MRVFLLLLALLFCGEVCAGLLSKCAKKPDLPECVKLKKTLEKQESNPSPSPSSPPSFSTPPSSSTVPPHSPPLSPSIKVESPRGGTRDSEPKDHEHGAENESPPRLEMVIVGCTLVSLLLGTFLLTKLGNSSLSDSDRRLRAAAHSGDSEAVGVLLGDPLFECSEEAIAQATRTLHEREALKGKAAFLLVEARSTMTTVRDSGIGAQDTRALSKYAKELRDFVEMNPGLIPVPDLDFLEAVERIVSFLTSLKDESRFTLEQLSEACAEASELELTATANRLTHELEDRKAREERRERELQEATMAIEYYSRQSQVLQLTAGESQSQNADQQLSELKRKSTEVQNLPSGNGSGYAFGQLAVNEASFRLMMSLAQMQGISAGERQHAGIELAKMENEARERHNDRQNRMEIADKTARENRRLATEEGERNRHARQTSEEAGRDRRRKEHEDLLKQRQEHFDTVRMDAINKRNEKRFKKALKRQHARFFQVCIIAAALFLGLTVYRWWKDVERTLVTNPFCLVPATPLTSPAFCIGAINYSWTIKFLVFGVLGLTFFAYNFAPDALFYAVVAVLLLPTSFALWFFQDLLWERCLAMAIPMAIAYLIGWTLHTVCQSYHKTHPSMVAFIRLVRDVGLLLFASYCAHPAGIHV